MRDDGGNDRAARAAQKFAAVVTHWRRHRGMSQQKFAESIKFHSSYVSHIESRRHRPTEAFARSAEQVLATGGVIMASWQDYHDAKRQAFPHAAVTTAGFVTIAVEDSWHRLVDGHYETTVRRTVVNETETPLRRMALVIPPGQLVDGAAYQVRRPTVWADMGLRARCDGRAMDFAAEQYRDGLLEGWLLFRAGSIGFAVGPGRSAIVEYTYRIPVRLCNPWFEQVVTMPTGSMTLHLQFPPAVAPARVWGTEASMSGERTWPNRPVRLSTGAGVEFRCQVARPVVDRTYRWEWPPVMASRRDAVPPAA
jgi:transcriptional regulator with XRE-family HTH domain